MKQQQKNPVEADASIPSFWECSQDPDMQLAMKVPANASEKQLVNKMVEHALDKIDIVSIHRVENPRLWAAYHGEYNSTLKSVSTADEKRMFYGCDADNITFITKNGVISQDGTELSSVPELGDGFYFSSDLRRVLPTRFDSNTYGIVICKVFIGYFKVGSNDGDLEFDSFVDTIEKRVVLKVKSSHSYPEYILTVKQKGGTEKKGLLLDLDAPPVLPGPPLMQPLAYPGAAPPSMGYSPPLGYPAGFAPQPLQPMAYPGIQSPLQGMGGPAPPPSYFDEPPPYCETDPIEEKRPL